MIGEERARARDKFTDSWTNYFQYAAKESLPYKKSSNTAHYTPSFVSFPSFFLMYNQEEEEEEEENDPSFPSLGAIYKTSEKEEKDRQEKRLSGGKKKIR